MNKSSKYKLDTAAIVGFIIGVLLIIGVNRFLFNDNMIKTENVRIMIVVILLSIFATVFGSISGALTAFFGVICASAVAGQSVDYVHAVVLTIMCIMIGTLASKYKIREGEFGYKQMLLWNLTNVTAQISAFVFVLPLLEYIFYGVDLFEFVKKGMALAIIASIPVGLVLTVFFYLFSRLLND